MSSLPIDFQLPAWLLLLPLCLLPWVSRSRDAVVVAWTDWLPEDVVGRCLDRLWKALAMLTIIATVLALAQPGRSESWIERAGRGAEILILLDRSSSMDAKIRRVKPVEGNAPTEIRSKNDLVRDALGWLLEQRPDNQFALTMFNAAPIPIAPFTDDVAVVQAGLNASAIGRGPAETNMGDALLAAVGGFDGREYRGSRAILLVSDGGARLEESVRNQIAALLREQQIDLYFLYVHSSPNIPDFDTVGTDVNAELEEVALHSFFAGLDTEYRVFQAGDPDAMARAVEEIDRQQNLPLTWLERTPRLDYSAVFYRAALVCCLLLATLSITRMGRDA